MKITVRISWVLIALSILLVVTAASCGEEETPTTSPSPTMAVPSPSPPPEPYPPPESSPTPEPTLAPIPFSLEPYTSLAHGVNLSVPRGWVIDESDPDTLTMANPTGLASIEITVNTFLAHPTEAQFDEYVSLGIVRLKQELSSFQEISRDRLTTPPGFLIRFNFTRNGDEAGALALYTYNNLRGALALATTDAAFYDLFASLFEETVVSLRVAPTPPAPTPTPAPTPIPTSTPFPTVTPGAYTDPTHGFTLQIPLGWGILGSGKEAIARLIGPGEIIVQVLTAKVPVEMSAGVYALVLRENRYEPLAGYSLVSQGDINLGTTTASEVQFTAATGPDPVY